MNKRQTIAIITSLALLCSCEHIGKNSSKEDKHSEYDTSFTSQEDYGIYALKDDMSKKTLVFDEYNAQFISSGKSSKLFYKMLDFKNSAYLCIDFSAGVTSLKEGSTVNATLQSSGIESLAAASGQVALEIVKNISGKVYLRDNTAGIGYIISE